jgi:glycosyltransferase involved in cell wall biosynthesis
MSATGGPRFSLVIPAYNEEAYLPRLLESVALARERYRGGASAIEVVVADNASTDATARIAERHGCRVVRVERRAIAAARNGGAAASSGELLCFIDADSRIHPETFNEIERRMATGRHVAGSTGVTLERWSLGLLATYLVAFLFVWLARMDSGVVFCRREDFRSIGGYDERRLFAEDVEFLWRLRKLGRPRGQGLIRARSAKAVASTRKFDKYGDWHYFTRMPGFAMCALFAPESTTKFARKYWYEDR